MEELIPTLQEEGEERIDTIAEQTIIAGVQTINGKAGDLNLKTINNTDLLTTGNLSLATPTDLSTAVSTHNTSATAHTDIRQAITSEATARENADTALNNAKQDKLVAGTNIQIAADGKTISATDTTYSAGSGLNLTGTTFSVDTNTIATQNDIYTLQTTKQDNLTTPQLNAVNSGIDSTKVAQIATNEGDIATINGKIPTQASTSNQLADKNFVNSSVQTATANYRGSWDDWASVPTQASDYPEDYAGSHTPTVNDYMVVQDASDYTEETLEGTWRFKYTGEWDTNGKSGWLPEYQVNETPLTAAQIAAINSGITDTLVAQISTNQSDISNLSTNKLDKTTTFWGQTAQNGAVQGTLTLTESGQNATIATSGHNTTDAGIKMGNSKNYVEAGVSTVTLSSTTGNIQLKPKSGSSVDVMSSKITNLATPTADTDASTKKYVDDGLATKQNTLTAGANITITGDEISATDTTYTAGTNVQITGTTISATDTTYSAGTGLTLTGTTFSVDDPAPSGFFTGNATTESEGTNITLPNALGTTIKNVELEGDTSQNGEPTPDSPIDINVVTGKQTVNITGKNLLDLSAQPSSINGATTSYDSTTNSLSVASTGSGSGYIYARYDLKTLKPGNTYNIKIGSFTNSSVTNERILYVTSYNGLSSTQLLEVKAPNLAGTLTIPSDSKEVRVYFYTLLNTTSVFQEVQLELGSATTYEPYVGQSYEIDLGNLWLSLPSDVSRTTTQGLSFMNNADGSVSVNAGTASGADANSLNSSSASSNNHYVHLKAGTYTLSGALTNYALQLVDLSGNELATTQSSTSVVLANDIDVFVRMRIPANTTVTAKTIYPQLVLGTTDTPIELCKIGNYQDYIYKTNGNWYKHAEVGKVVYNGSESWSITSNGRAFFVTQSNAEIYALDVIPSVMSDYYTPDTYRNVAGNGTCDYGIATHTSSERISIRNKDITTTANFQTWLSTHNTTVYYALATATDTQITNADLITQLEALASAQLTTGQNTITSAGVRPNLDAILTIEAFNNNWNGLSQALLGA